MGCTGERAAGPATPQSGLVDNIKEVVAEYIKVRDLRPMRVAVLGPPMSGKSALSELLAK